MRIERPIKYLLPLLVLTLASCRSVPARIDATSLPPLPAATANNAVASISVGGTDYIASFSGLGSGRTHSDTHSNTYLFDSDSGEWQQLEDVPGESGRLASVAATAGDGIYVFGGYSVAADGSEVSMPWVHRFDPQTRTFTLRAAMPVPVDDAVAVSYRNRYIYLISGWHDHGNVNLVQVFDTRENRWTQATPIPGRAVFGHAGGIVGHRIVYCDGVAVAPHKNRRRDFAAVDECYVGVIDADDVRNIDWRILEHHPGRPRYRMAAAGVAELNGVLFIGGSENPYNYNGIGYDGKASQPASDALLYSFARQSWQRLPLTVSASMDHRGLVQFGDSWVTVGGMLQDQQVTTAVRQYSLATIDQQP